MSAQDILQFRFPTMVRTNLELAYFFHAAVALRSCTFVSLVVIDVFGAVADDTMEVEPEALLRVL